MSSVVRVAALGKRWVLAAGVVLALGLAGCVVLFSVSFEIRDPALRARIVEHLAASSGLTIDASGPMDLRLLPRPSVECGDVRMAGLGGEVTIEADDLVGNLSLPGLLQGRLRVVSATIDAPTIVADLDRLGPLASAMLDGAAAASPPQGPAAADAPEPLRFLRTEGLTIRSGVLRLVSRDPQRDTLLTEITATVDWPNGPGAATVSGRASWRGTDATFAAALDAPEALLGGASSGGSLQLRSPVLDLLATGAIALGGGFHGTGTLSASTTDLLGFLRLAGTPLPQLRAFREASLRGQATLAPDTLSLSDMELGLDGMRFEGAMVVHDAAGRPGLAGTLDTEQIDLNPFLAALPAPRAPDGAWSEAAFDSRAVADDDIDLRISASKARIGPLEFEDGSLSLQSGSGRMELSLGEARAYDGLLKGRVVATLDNSATDIRADFSVSRLDLSALAKDVPEASGLAGTATGHVMLEGLGGSYGAILRTLDGRGQLIVRNGAVGARLATDVMRVPAEAPAAPMMLVNRLATFDSVSADFDVTRGAASLRRGTILWPDATAALNGWASIPWRSLDLTAALGTVTDEAGTPAPDPVAFALSGPWRDLRLTSPASGLAPRGAVE